ncbi:hypothetical protein LOK49_LG15G01436 [Camellia lanceoleosa]|uniref:Uncharacterized protein n=1 Tax=Camellia lanceoleosa TaxID=1840588 RepID=A0ACC0F6Y3_9ERIC|nr:hypothetical protein LOK49_LG15G01436 [Camellia lanceoleosa]
MILLINSSRLLFKLAPLIEIRLWLSQHLAYALINFYHLSSMGDSFDNLGSRKNCELTSVINNNKVSKSCLVASSPKSFSQKATQHVVSFNPIRMGRGTAGDAALFLLKVAALETVRRFSRAKCPFLWHGIQVLQVLCYPPLKWIQRWAPFKGLVNNMQALSRPLLVLSIATSFSDKSGCSNFTSYDINDSYSLNDSQASSELNSEIPSVQSTLETSPVNALGSFIVQPNYVVVFVGLSGLLIDEDELHRFYIAANGDFSCLLSSVKKTIRHELEMWSSMVFWHGFDVKYRPCLIVRLGLACSSLSSHERPCFLQAVVSQVEHGILHLVDRENPQITVLVDCEGMSRLRFPTQIMRSCFAIFQDHFPNRLGFLFAIRLPPDVRKLLHKLLFKF